MKIVFDRVVDLDVEHHARYLHRKMFREEKMPLISGATRALIPGWCHDCDERSWVPVHGGVGYCPSCREKRMTRTSPGFTPGD